MMPQTVIRTFASFILWCLAVTVAAQPLGRDDARFLLTRTGFAPSFPEISAYEHLTRQQAVDRLLGQATTTALTNAPAWTGQPLVSFKQVKDKSDAEKKEFRDAELKRGFDLRGWWLNEMLTTSSPLTERMTLFWHNHFVSSQQKVKYSQLMYRQNILFRQHALGNFGSLLHAVSKDSAMLIYLDNANNKKGAPNENFAREVMELFTLGEGHYTEQDIKEIARAFTGLSIEPETGEFKWRPFIHDDGTKTVFGRSGNFDGDAVLDIILAQPACAEFIVTKLWQEFVSPKPDTVEIARVATHFRNSGYDLRVALRELFLSRSFWDGNNRGTLVKSPVEMVVGAVKQFDFRYDDPLPFTFAVAQLGQNIFSPPNVRGWPGGDAWINSTTLLARKSVLERLFRATESVRRKMAKPITAVDLPAGDAMRTAREEMNALGKVKGQGALGREGRVQFANAASMISFDPDTWLGRFGTAADVTPDLPHRLAIQKAILPLEPTAPIRADLAGTAYLRTLVMDPVYQLK